MAFDLDKLVKRGAGYLPPWLLQRIIYFRHHGRFPDLRNPLTFTEKIQWRKLFDRNPKFPLLSDKLASKAFVAEHFGSEWVTPTLWSGERVTVEILAGLPRPFVIKPTHSTAAPVFVSSGETGWEELARRCNRWVPLRHAPQSHEWGYDDVPRALIAEPLLGGDPQEPPKDYKLYVFGGHVEYIHVDTDRFRGHKRAFFTRDWEPVDLFIRIPFEPRPIQRPATLEQMIAFAEGLAQLAAPDFIRVDCYEIDGRPYFGEVAFYPDSGYRVFTPREMDRRFGELWPLPQRSMPMRRGHHNSSADSSSLSSRLGKDGEAV
jgi:hypothetical protein